MRAGLRWWVAVLILVLGLIGLPGLAPLAAEQPVRIVAFNAEVLVAPGVSGSTRIEKYRFDTARQAHMEAVAAIIETLRPDILNIGEVTSVEAIDGVVAILHEKGLTDYRGYHIENSDNFTGMDVALITRFVPDEVEGARIRHLVPRDANDTKWRGEFSFTDPDSGETRTLRTILGRHSVYYFTLGRHKLGFLGLHLKANPDDLYSNTRRTGETAIARQIVREEIVGRGYLPIVLGDLNDYDPDVPDADETRSTKTTVLRDMKHFDPEGSGPQLFNVAARIPRQADRWTCWWDRNENGVEDPYDVKTMIDHILLPNEMAPWIRRVQIDHSVDSRVSDHRPVIVDLVLPD